MEEIDELSEQEGRLLIEFEGGVIHTALYTVENEPWPLISFKKYLEPEGPFKNVPNCGVDEGVEELDSATENLDMRLDFEFTAEDEAGGVDGGKEETGE